MEEAACLKDKALFVLVELADTCISTMVFNAIITELFWFVEVMGSNANNAKAWHETFVVEVTGSNANDVKAWRETLGVEDTWTFYRKRLNPNSQS